MMDGTGKLNINLMIFETFKVLYIFMYVPKIQTKKCKMILPTSKISSTVNHDVEFHLTCKIKIQN